MRLLWPLLLGVASSSAAPPPWPVVVRGDAPGKYASAMQAQGVTTPEPLACEALVLPSHAICFQSAASEGTWEWTTLTEGAEVVSLRPAEVAGYVQSYGSLVPITNTSYTYWLSTGPRGQGAQALYYPAQLMAALSTTQLTVATPNQHIVVAWAGGDATLDRMMLVGVREMYDNQPNPVSPKALRWIDGKWVEFGAAVPR